MYLGVQAFFSRISDPQIGGTYMSILNTLWYLGVAVARIVALGLLNSLTIKQCSTDKTNVCWSKTDIKVGKLINKRLIVKSLIIDYLYIIYRYFDLL